MPNAALDAAALASADQRLNELSQALSLCQSPTEMKRFLIDLCSPAELRALAERWHVARLLDEGQLSYRQINDLTGVSTTTIGRVARFLTTEPHQGYRLVLDRLDDQAPVQPKDD